MVHTHLRVQSYFRERRPGTLQEKATLFRKQAASRRASIIVKGRGQVYPVTCHEGITGQKRYRSSLSWTSEPVRGVLLTTRHGRFTPPPRKWPGMHCTGVSVGHRAGLDKRENVPPLGVFVFSCTLYFTPTCCFVFTVLHSAICLYLKRATQTIRPPGGTRTRNPSKRETRDLCLRPRSHRDRHSIPGPSSSQLFQPTEYYHHRFQFLRLRVKVITVRRENTTTNENAISFVTSKFRKC